MRGVFAAHDSLYVDVDGTLLLWPDGKPGRVPRPNEVGYGEEPRVNVELVDELRAWRLGGGKSRPRLLYIWSRGGRDHSEMAARLTGLTDIVDGCLPKPSAIVDDGARKGVEKLFRAKSTTLYTENMERVG